MKNVVLPCLALALAAHASSTTRADVGAPAPTPASGVASTAPADQDALNARMAWWREARLGMFIHFGLYAIPAGTWGDKHGYGEWIRYEARIPVGEYDKFQQQFNPAGFDADAIVKAAKSAGMKYIVITTKHHDGFCLFDSAVTDFDVMGSPFKRDIMKELAEACRREGIKMCWYYSIMDWHHPDYLPRRDWEADRPTDKADFERYMVYMKAQLKELLAKYGDIGVLWFDGQWEGNWNDERGRDLEAYVRSLQPNIIINSRVGRGGGDYGLNGGRLGDYSTPEQFIPDAAPGGDWETCMTMNDHWGYNAADHKFKSAADLIRKTADIAGKGGNFLLNVGPTPEGKIPPESLERLATMGKWMSVNGESIHGTLAGPFPKSLPWGACTARPSSDGKSTRLYVHVFDWPKDGRLLLPGLYSQPVEGGAWLLASKTKVAASPENDGLTLNLSGVSRPDEIDSVIVLDLPGKPDVAIPPTIAAADAPTHAIESPFLFLGSTRTVLTPGMSNVEVRYTLDGSDPTPASPVASGPVEITSTCKLTARCFRTGKAVSPASSAAFTKAVPIPATTTPTGPHGIAYSYFEMPGDIKALAEMTAAKPIATGTCKNIDLSLRKREKNWGMVYRALIDVPADGICHFYVASDDGSRMWVDDKLVVDNDTPHSFKEVGGSIALAKGLHPITIGFFENWGGFDLKVAWSGPGIARQPLPDDRLFQPTPAK